MARSSAAAAAVALLAGVAFVQFASAGAAASPIGSWTRSDGLVYRFAPLPGGAVARYAMTVHRTNTNHCLVPANTLVYRYHPVGGGVYLVDSLVWDSGCKTSWENGAHRLKIAATATTLTLSCFEDTKTTCWTYHRAAAAAPPAPDRKAPVLRALPSVGKVGGVTALRYVVSDESRRSWEAFLLYRDGLVVRRYRTPLGPAIRGRLYAYKLDRTPAGFRGTFAFCVVSHDRAGNTTEPSCATVTIR